MSKKAQKFWDRFAARYAKSPVSDQATYEKKLKITRAYFSPESKVLEIGCGTGSTAIAHAPFVGHIHATDISPKMIEIAKAKAGGVGNISFEAVGIDDINLPEAGYDVVLALNILHLMPNMEEVVAQMARLLRPGGVFVSSTACMGGGAKLLKLVLPAGKALGLLPPVRFFDERTLLAAHAKAGLKIEQRWQKTPKSALFLVAKKAGPA